MYYYFIANLSNVFERTERIDTDLYPQFTELTTEQVEYHLAHSEAKRWEIEHHDDPVPAPVPQNEPTFEDIIADLKIFFQPQFDTMSDQEALARKSVFPTWTSKMGEAAEVGLRVWDDNRLWKCRTAHTIQSDWRPADTPALWEEISMEDGTREHPIHYNNNMRLELGKFYTQADVLYECIRDSEIAVYNNLADLVGLYVQVA